jgi:tetratricopeptide (TPR) repeat protein
LQPSQPLLEAEGKLEAGDFAGAQALLETYLATHPADARALFDRGYVEDAQDHPAEAEGDYRRAIAANPQQFESRLALGLMLAARSLADPVAATEARLQLEAATTLQPNPANTAAQAQASRALARLLRTSDPEAARQALLAALKLSPQTPADTLLTAEIAEAAGDPETAEEAYRGVLASASSSDQSGMEATTGLAHLLIAQKKYPDAEQLLRKALAQRAADPVLNSQLANVLMAEGKPEQAITILETLHGGRPGDRNLTRLLADLYTQNGQAAAADPLYVQLLSTPPAPDAALLAARGDNLVRQQRFADAVTVLEQATHLDSQNGGAWSSLAFAASESHQPKLVLDSLNMRSKVMPETPATYFLAATAWDTLHQTKRAVEMYKQFLAVAGGKFPDQEWQAKHRLVALSR